MKRITMKKNDKMTFTFGELKEMLLNESEFDLGLEEYLARRERKFKPSHTNPSWDESEDKIWAIQDYLSSMGEFTEEDREFLRRTDPVLLELEDEDEDGF